MDPEPDCLGIFFPARNARPTTPDGLMAGCNRRRVKYPGQDCRSGSMRQPKPPHRTRESGISALAPKKGASPHPANVRPLLLWFLHDDSASHSTSDPDFVSGLLASPAGPSGLSPGPGSPQCLPKRLHRGSLERTRLAVRDRIPDRDCRSLRNPLRPVPVGTRHEKGRTAPGHPGKARPERIQKGYLAVLWAITMASAMRSDQLSIMLRARSPSHQLPSWAGASSVFITAAA